MQGFSLIEFMVAMIIFIVMVGILLASTYHARSIFQTSDISATIQSSTRLAMQDISNDLKRTSRTRISIIQNNPTSGTDSIFYSLPLDSNLDGQPDLDSSGNIVWDTLNITIWLSPTYAGQLTRVGGDGSTEVLAQDVAYVNFADQGIDVSLYQDELEVVLGLAKNDLQGRTYSTSLTSVINMRN
ncbi:PilW family protein [Thermoproteota archaeon]